MPCQKTRKLEYVQMEFKWWTVWPQTTLHSPILKKSYLGQMPRKPHLAGVSPIQSLHLD